MSESDKKMKVVFAPGCFDSFDGTQEELDTLLADIQRMVDSGEIFEKAIPLTEETIDSMTDEELEQIARSMDFIETDESPSKKLH